MLRSLVFLFKRSLSLHSVPSLQKLIVNTNYLQAVRRCSNLHPDDSTPGDYCKAKHVSASLTFPSGGNGEYIVPYRKEEEMYMSKKMFIEALHSNFSLRKKEIDGIMTNETVREACMKRYVLTNLRLLCEMGVSKRSLIDYPWMITIERGILLAKLNIIKRLTTRDINHFVVFLHLSVPRLKKLVQRLNRESNDIPHSNRIYYISEKLKTDPYIVSKYLSQRLFVLEMPLSRLDLNLQNMIDYNIAPMSMLRDLWALRYGPKGVKQRFERAKRARKRKIMPWMARCAETVLERSIKLSQDELAILGDRSNVIEYVAERLQFGVEETKAIMMKHPKVLRVRVTKVKEVLDYLLGEAEFSRYDIAKVPRILCHGLETTKQRLEELKSYGCRPSSLVILCRSKREYEKFVRHWLNSSNNSNNASENALNPTGVGKDDAKT